VNYLDGISSGTFKFRKFSRRFVLTPGKEDLMNGLANNLILMVLHVTLLLQYREALDVTSLLTVPRRRGARVADISANLLSIVPIVILLYIFFYCFFLVARSSQLMFHTSVQHEVSQVYTDHRGHGFPISNGSVLANQPK
jgi:hypothetical protein